MFMFMMIVCCVLVAFLTLRKIEDAERREREAHRDDYDIVNAAHNEKMRRIDAMKRELKKQNRD